MEIVIDSKTSKFYDFLPERKIEIMETALSVFAPYAPVEKSNLHKLSVIEIIKRHDVVVVPYSIINRDQMNALRSVSTDFTEYGMFYKNTEGKSFIYYNDAKSEKICELTLLHELGHLFLNHTQQSYIAEQEADFFAAICMGYLYLLRDVKKEGLF